MEHNNEDGMRNET